jgi:hypothetical protein
MKTRQDYPIDIQLKLMEADRRIAEEERNTTRTLIVDTSSGNYDSDVHYCTCPGKNPWFEHMVWGNYGHSRKEVTVYETQVRTGHILEHVACPEWIAIAKQKGLMS